MIAIQLNIVKILTPTAAPKVIVPIQKFVTKAVNRSMIIVRLVMNAAQVVVLKIVVPTHSNVINNAHAIQTVHQPKEVRNMGVVVRGIVGLYKYVMATKNGETIATSMVSARLATVELASVDVYRNKKRLIKIKIKTR